MSQRKMPRLLLVEPPFYRLFHQRYSLDVYPTSLGSLASVVRQRTRWDVHVYNADFVPGGRSRSLRHLYGAGFRRYLDLLADESAPIWQEIERNIAEIRPDVVGITATSAGSASAFRVAEAVKRASPRTLTVLGGPHATIADTAGLECAAMDVAVRGEGELTLVALLDAIERNRPWNEVSGLVFRSDGAIVRTAERPLIADLDTLPFPHRDAPHILYEYPRYPLTAFRYLLASRGCPFRCTYCGASAVWGHTVRHRSPASIVQQMASLRRMGLTHLYFQDDSFGHDRQRLRRLCEAIADARPGVTWGCTMHASSVDREVAAWLHRAGCVSVEIGVESGSSVALARMRKGVRLEQIREACAAIKAAGLLLQVNVMIGFPWDTDESLKATLGVIDALRADQVLYSIFTPYPGTEAFTACEQDGLLDDTHDPARCLPFTRDTWFAPNIPRPRFEAIMHEIWKRADRDAWTFRVRRLLSRHGLGRLRELGVARAMRQGLDGLLSR